MIVPKRAAPSPKYVDFEFSLHFSFLDAYFTANEISVHSKCNEMFFYQKCNKRQIIRNSNITRTIYVMYELSNSNRELSGWIR